MTDLGDELILMHAALAAAFGLDPTQAEGDTAALLRDLAARDMVRQT